VHSSSVASLTATTTYRESIGRNIRGCNCRPAIYTVTATVVCYVEFTIIIAPSTMWSTRSYYVAAALWKCTLSWSWTRWR